MPWYEPSRLIERPITVLDKAWNFLYPQHTLHLTDSFEACAAAEIRYQTEYQNHSDQSDIPLEHGPECSFWGNWNLRDERQVIQNPNLRNQAAFAQAKEEQIPLADALMLNAPEDWASAIKNTL
jgi:hypothetical protein